MYGISYRQVHARGALPGRTVTSALGSAEKPSLLEGASHGPAGRWVLLQRVR